jgi:hypothetical protein
MGARTRRIGLVGAGLLGLAAPLVAGQAPAAAAVSEADKALTFFTKSSGGTTAVTCHVRNHTNVDKGEPDAPFTEVSVPLGSQPAPCIDNIAITVNVAYRDHEGVARRAEFDSSTPGQVYVEGTYSNIRTTVEITYLDCDAEASATCSAAAEIQAK